MADSSPPRSRRKQSQSQSQSAMTKITELDVDSLVHCANYLDNLQDLSNLAMSCKYLKRVAYSNSIWLRWFRFYVTVFFFLSQIPYYIIFSLDNLLFSFLNTLSILTHCLRFHKGMKWNEVISFGCL